MERSRHWSGLFCCQKMLATDTGSATRRQEAISNARLVRATAGADARDKKSGAAKAIATHERSRSFVNSRHQRHTITKKLAHWWPIKIQGKYKDAQIETAIGSSFVTNSNTKK